MPPTSQPSAKTKVVFTRVLHGGVKLVVKSTELAFILEKDQLLGGWLQPDFVPRVFTFELHLPDGTVFPACSLPFGDSKTVPPADRWQIMDATRLDGWIIFAAYENPYIMMVRYNMDTGETERVNLGNGRWNNYSVSMKLPGTVKLSLSKSNLGLCTAEVIYEQEGLRRITHFVETGDKWKFRMTDEKNIDLPATGNPGK